MDDTLYTYTLQVEFGQHFDHTHIRLWSPHYHITIGCAAENAGREVLEALSRFALTDGFVVNGGEP